MIASHMGSNHRTRIFTLKARTTLLGTGGPRPDPNRHGSAVAIQIGSDCLLFDAGRGVTTQLVRAGIQPQCVRTIFITHFHFDHIGNLGELLLTAWNNGRSQPLLVFGPKGIRKIINNLLDTIYASDISFRMTEAALTQDSLVDIRELIKVREIEPDGPGPVHEEPGWQVYAGHVDHGHSLGISRDAWVCLGYRIEIGGNVITISGDTVDCPGIRRLAQGADLLIMCSYLAESEINSPAAALIADHILASPSAAGRIAAHAGVKRLVLTHIREKSGNLQQTMVDDSARFFSGEVIVGQDLMHFD
jgi:ribonuclease Z